MIEIFCKFQIWNCYIELSTFTWYSSNYFLWCPKIFKFNI